MVRIVSILAFGLAITQGAALAADYGLPPQPNPLIAVNSFVGGYVALGGSYGVGSPRNFSLGSDFTGSGFALPFSSNGSPAGWAGVAAGGYNMTFGPALVGIELDGRWGNERFAKDDGSVANTNGFAPAGRISYGYSFANQAGVHLSGRLGAVFGETLVFGKVGAGASRVKDTFAADQTTATRCASISLAGTVSCVGPTVGGAGSFAQTRWVPSLLIGVGAERNLGVFFVRGGVEAEMLAQDTLSITQPTANGWSFSGSATSPNTQWTVRANAMVGIRF
jgi:hypothetical protein